MSRAHRAGPDCSGQLCCKLRLKLLGKEEGCSPSSSLQRGWPARMATRWSSHRLACSIRYRSPHVSSSANDSFKKFTGAHCVALTIHTFRTVEPQVIVLFGKRWEFGDNREVWKAFVCQYAPPRSCCSWGTAEAKRCMPVPRRLHCGWPMMWSTLSSQSADASHSVLTFRWPNGYFFAFAPISSLKM